MAEGESLTKRPIWYEDGDIILQVNDSEDKSQHHFRVHSLILRLASPVFRDMLAIPQTKDMNPNPMLEGWPVVVLDDSPKDLHALLGALYKGLVSPQGYCMDLDSALGILLLSDKYVMGTLREGIIRLIQEDWPLNRSDYLARQKLLGSPGLRVVQSAKIIKTARRCNVAELLPTAFHELAASSFRNFTPDEMLGLSQLSQDDLARLLVGRSRSEERVRRLAHALELRTPRSSFLWNSNTNAVPDDIFNCRYSFPRCGTRPLQKFCSDLSTPFLSQLGNQLLKGGSAAIAVRELRETRLCSDNLCTGCRDWLLSILENKEEELWENVPVDFELPEIDSKLYSDSIFKTL